MARTFQEYAKHVRTEVCFDTIVEIKKAIRNKDEASALVALGELKEQIAVLDHYIEAMERANDPSSAR